MHMSYNDFTDDDDSETFTEDVAVHLTETLTKCQVPLLSSHEQFHLVDIIECIGMVEKHRRSIDDNAGRFLLFFRQHVLRDGQHTVPPIGWREITWAYHSNSQDIMVDLVSRHFGGKMLWCHAKESGMFMWMTDVAAIVSPFSVLYSVRVATNIYCSELNSKILPEMSTPRVKIKILWIVVSTILRSGKRQFL
jgi:hypothetical protein